MALPVGLAIATAWGCSSDKLKTYRLTVRVTHEGGKPLAGATVVFRSLEQRVTATGATDGDGRCELGTYQPGDGVVAGQHQASVVMQTPPGDPDEVRAPAAIPIRMSSPATSGLKYSISDDGPTEITIEIPAQ